MLVSFLWGCIVAALVLGRWTGFGLYLFGIVILPFLQVAQGGLHGFSPLFVFTTTL